MKSFLRAIVVVYFLFAGILLANTPTYVSVKSGEIYTLPTSVEVNPEKMETSNYTIEFTAQAVNNEKLVATSESRFLGTIE